MKRITFLRTFNFEETGIKSIHAISFGGFSIDTMDLGKYYKVYNTYEKFK